jgi:hypothetical protein
VGVRREASFRLIGTVAASAMENQALDHLTDLFGDDPSLDLAGEIRLDRRIDYSRSLFCPLALAC